jgi:exodeoxyribonuclease VII large subunit
LTQQIPILSVSELSGLLKSHIEDSFGLLAIRGEVSNVSRSANGHVFLSLKDQTAQLRAVLWRDTARALKFQLKDGLEVIAVGGLDLYPARGTYQLVVDELVPQGIGALELAFRQMREKLAAEGLFDADRKRPLPRIPRRIALVTSPQGAAVRDMLQVILRRWPAADIVIVPVPVQGDGAAERIARGIKLLPLLPEVDVAIVGRGGGSLEDLWPFNEEVVARAIADSPIPIISAVGHEIDVSISDLVADHRALTPSEAGETVVPDAAELQAGIAQLLERLQRAITSRLSTATDRLHQLRDRPALSDPTRGIDQLRSRLDEAWERLALAQRNGLARGQADLSRLTGTLDALSPLKVLSRGYSITLASTNGTVIRSADQTQVGELIETRLESGRLISRVETIELSGILPG